MLHNEFVKGRDRHRGQREEAGCLGAVKTQKKLCVEDCSGDCSGMAKQTAVLLHAG